MISAIVTSKKTLRTSVEPPLIARREPTMAPVTLDTAIKSPNFKRITPFSPKIIIAPTFVETFTIFAIAIVI